MKMDLSSWSPTSYNTFQLCEQKFFLTKGRRLVPISSSPGQKMMWGKLWHGTTDAYDLLKWQGLNHEDSLKGAINYLWANRKLIQPSFIGQYWDNSRTLETLVRSICWYTEHYKDDPVQLITLSDGKPAIEVPFIVNVPGVSDKVHKGIVDRIVTFEGALYILDRKSTSSELSGYYFSQFAPDNQVMDYIWGLRNGLKIPIAGFMVDACQVLVSGTRFQRAVFDVTEDQIQEWLVTLKDDMVRADHCNDTNNWPLRFSACSMYGGCEFKGICSKSPLVREALIQELFTERNRDNEPNPVV